MSKPVTILIVDDELQNRRLLETQLRPEGYVTVSVASGEEALALVAQRAPDLILLDVMMPGMDGFEVASFSVGQDGPRCHARCAEKETTLGKPLD